MPTEISRTLLFLFCLSGWFLTPSMLDASPLKGAGGEFLFNFDNDVILGNTDQYYTSGGRMELAFFYEKAGQSNSSDTQLKSPPPLFSRVGQAKNVRNIFQGISTGNELYTPTNIEKTEVSFGDRPYSAWSFLGLFWGLNKSHGARTILHRFDLEYGGIGPNANGGPVQNLVHKTIASNSRNPQGWGQLNHGESGLRFTYKYRNLSRVKYHTQSGFEVSPSLGNVKTDLNLGGFLKLGKINDSGQFETNRGLQIYAILNPSLTFVGFDAHLEGGLYDGKTVRVKNYDFLDYVAYDLLTGGADQTQKFSSFQYLFVDQLSHPRIDRYNYINRYLTIYKPIFNTNNHSSFGPDFVMYNVLFNQGEALDDEGKRFIMMDLLVNPVQDPLELAVIYHHLYTQEKPIDIWLKYAAYRNLVTRSNLRTYDPLLHTWIFWQLIQKKKPEDTYTVKKKKFYGTLRLGFGIDYKRFTFQVLFNWRSQEFEQRKDLPSSHFFGTFALGVRW